MTCWSCFCAVSCVRYFVSKASKNPHNSCLNIHKKANVPSYVYSFIIYIYTYLDGVFFTLGGRGTVYGDIFDFVLQIKTQTQMKNLRVTKNGLPICYMSFLGKTQTTLLPLNTMSSIRKEHVRQEWCEGKAETWLFKHSSICLCIL